MLMKPVVTRSLFVFVLTLSSCCWSFTVNGFLDQYDTLIDRLASPFVFLPEYHMESEVNAFLLHKNDFFRERYLFEASMSAEIGFFSIVKTVYSFWTFNLFTGAGQKPGNTAFTVLDIDYGIDPTVEVRLSPLYIQTGVEHRCFHEVDRSELGLIHWNRLFIGASSPNFRAADYWKTLVVDKKWGWQDRLSWFGRAGMYPYSFFGLLGDQFLSRDNWKRFEGNVDLRYALWSRRTWMVNARAKFMGGIWEEPDQAARYYWRTDLILESNFIRGKQGALFYLDYILDDLPLYNGLPRFSKDQLLQVGFRFFI